MEDSSRDALISQENQIEIEVSSVDLERRRITEISMKLINILASNSPDDPTTYDLIANFFDDGELNFFRKIAADYHGQNSNVHYEKEDANLMLKSTPGANSDQILHGSAANSMGSTPVVDSGKTSVDPNSMLKNCVTVWGVQGLMEMELSI